MAISCTRLSTLKLQIFHTKRASLPQRDEPTILPLASVEEVEPLYQDRLDLPFSPPPAPTWLAYHYAIRMGTAPDGMHYDCLGRVGVWCAAAIWIPLPLWLLTRRRSALVFFAMSQCVFRLGRDLGRGSWRVGVFGGDGVWFEEGVCICDCGDLMLCEDPILCVFRFETRIT